MKKTFLIHDGAHDKGIVLCKKLLEENNTSSSSFNKIICIDKQDNINKVSKFMSSENFLFIPLSKDKKIDINEKIDVVIIIEE